MTFKNIVFSLCAVTALSACETFYMPGHSQQPKGEVIELPQRPTKSRYELPHGMMTETMGTAELMSNESVIVFPVDGNIDPMRKTFPEYRSVVENTTAGGYTVFDPSVTVFAVEDGGSRPEYLPEYAVPRYIEQAQIARPTAAPRQQPLTGVNAGPLPLVSDYPMATPLEPIHVTQPTQSEVFSIAPDIQAEPLPRPPRMTEAGRVSVPEVHVTPSLTRAQPQQIQQQQPQQRRSRPVLTGY